VPICVPQILIKCPLYKGAQRVFSYAPGHAGDPLLVETIATWNALFEGVYASAWHQQLVADPAFRAARHEREEQRTWPMNAWPS
jgi:hypothetical protein